MKRMYFLLLSAFASMMAMAQDGHVNVDITKSSTSTTSFPWIWVVGGLVFVILLVALLSGGRGGTDRVVEKKTIIRE